MSKSTLNKYIWIVSTIQRYGKLTREELNDLWVKSSLSGGEPLSRRTFYNYRQQIAEMFNIEIVNNPSTYEYHIESDDSVQMSRMVNLLLDTASISGMLGDSHNVKDRIILEDVPSARDHLPLIMQALNGNNRISFTYRAYNRVNPTFDVLVEPYCIRLFKQLWYVIGFNKKDRKIKTYALDRMSCVIILPETFDMPGNFNATAYFNDCFGIMTSRGRAKRVVLRATPGKAKYLRALPLHHSQKETVHDHYSIFQYRLLLTNDLVAEILSHGAEVQVVRPLELRALVMEQLRAALEKY